MCTQQRCSVRTTATFNRKHPNSGYISQKTSGIERLVSPEHENVQ